MNPELLRSQRRGRRHESDTARPFRGYTGVTAPTIIGGCDLRLGIHLTVCSKPGFFQKILRIRRLAFARRKYLAPLALLLAIPNVGATLILAAQNPSATDYQKEEIRDPAAYLYYTNIKTVVDYPPVELIHKYPELKRLQPASS
ncbi:MAG: hypothetical protein ACRD2O_14915, partial [Terriglobia bacterium]